MPLYLQTIGFSIAGIGLLEGIAEAMAGLSKGYFGRMSDRMQSRLPFVRWGYIISALSKPLLILWPSVGWVFGMRTADRLGKGIRTGARDAMLSAQATPETKGKVFGFHRSLDTAGAALGPLAALIYLYFHPGAYRWLFVAALIPGLLAVVFTLFLHETPSGGGRKGSGSFFGYLRYWKISSTPYKYLVTGLLAFTLFNSSDAFLLLGLKSAGYSDSGLISTYIFYNLVYALLSYPLGSLADRVGLKQMMVSGLAVFALVYSLMGFANSQWQFALLFGLYGYYSAATEGISKALISNLTVGNETATAIGFYTSLASIAALLASSLAGLIWYLWGMKTMFLVSGIGVALVVAYFLIGTDQGMFQAPGKEVEA